MKIFVDKNKIILPLLLFRRYTCFATSFESKNIFFLQKYLNFRQQKRLTSFHNSHTMCPYVSIVR